MNPDPHPSTGPAPADSTRGRFWFAVFLLATVAIGLRLLNLDQSLWIDEAGSIALASAPDFNAAVHQDVHPPLYSAILRVGLKFTHSVAQLRFFSVACGFGLFLLVVTVMRRSLAATIVAGAIIAALPELIFHSAELRSYALLYLLLGTALALAASIFAGRAVTSARLILMAALALASATHLVTAFFVLAIVPLLWWPVRQQGVRGWMIALSPLIPSALLLLWLRYVFIVQPEALAGGWWMPPASLPSLWASLMDAIGWKDIQWLAAASARRVSAAAWLLPLLAGGALVFSIWTAWGHRSGRPLKTVLLASALGYLGVIMAYSAWFEPVVMARTLVPGLLPGIAALAWGIGSHPVAWRRQAAAAAVVLYLTFAVLPTIRLSLTPAAGLRGLAATIQAKCHPRDALVLFRSLDYGLAPYGVGLDKTRCLTIDQTKVAPTQLAELRQRLARLDPSARVLLACREDYYFSTHRDVFESVTAELAAGGRIPRIVWHERDLTLLVAESVSYP